MKKLMFVAAAVAASVAVAEGITSANVVGYQTFTTAETSFSGGPTFKFIGSEGTYKLGDFKALGMDITGDSIQFLDMETASPYIEATYAGPEYGASEGWWDFNDVGGTPLGEEEFANGTAFLASFTSGNDIEITYAGEVMTGSDVTIAIPAGTVAPFLCNPTPVDLTLGQITAEGMAIDGDSFQFLDTESASAYVEATYAGEEYGSSKGWWDFNDVGGTPLDDQPLVAGGAMLGSITSGNEVTVVFPDPLAETEE